MKSIGTMSMGAFDDIADGAGDSVGRYRLWLKLMTHYDRKRISKVIVIRECVPDPESDLVFEGGELVG